MQKPQLSVLMPVYNAGSYVAKAVESILKQTFSDFEFIIIDDGSTDNSFTILQDYANTDKRIQLIHRGNKGIVATRNELLTLAGGEYFAIMDADDISYPQRLENQLAFLSNHSDHVIVGCQSMLIDPEGLPITTINTKSGHDEVDSANLHFDEFQTLNAYMANCQKLRMIGGYRKEVLYAEDRDVFLRMAEIGRVAVLPEVLYGYRQHLTNTCVTKKHEVAENVRQVVSEAHERRGITIENNQPVSHKKDISLIEQYSAWAWLALNAGNLITARKYATKVFFRSPLSIESWRLMFCSVRGY